MKFDDRRPERAKRGSTRNESCGLGGNEPPEKPRLKEKEETVPVRKPRFPKGTPPKNKGKETVKDPGKIKEPKPSGLSLNDPVKMLEEFNSTVNQLTLAGLTLVEKAGGFSEVAKKQKSLLKKFRSVGEDNLPEELVESLRLLEKTTRSRKYVRKVEIRNPKPGGRKFRYIYE